MQTLQEICIFFILTHRPIFFSRFLLLCHFRMLTFAFSPPMRSNRSSSVVTPMENSRTAKRIMSTISKHSEEAEDDEICSGNL